jgi:imidazolonepropionase-like amidohydrolase
MTSRCQFACLVICAFTSSVAYSQDSRVKAITGVTLIDGTGRGPLQDAVIVIDGARISQVGARSAVIVPQGATVIDGKGRFVIPGLADMHHHLLSGSTFPRPNRQVHLRRMLAVGVTTVFNPSLNLKDFAVLKGAAGEDASPFPRFYSTGPMLSIKGDVMATLEGGASPDTPADARTVVRDLKAAGVDAIKVQRDDMSWGIKQRFPVMKEEVLAAVVTEAHQQGLKVFVHAPMLKYAKESLRAGVDGLMHGIIDEPVDREFLDLMKRNRASYVSTMTLFNDVADFVGWANRQAPNWDKAAFQPPRLYDDLKSERSTQRFAAIWNNASSVKEHLPVQRANLKNVFDAGVPIVLGTDTGFEGILIGVSTHIELELLVDAGLAPAAALQTATINAARMVGRDKDLGTVEPGKLADLVVLEADPLADIRNVSRIYRTFKGGVSYEPVDTARTITIPPPVR